MTLHVMVEGQSEAAALPILLRRIASERFACWNLDVVRPDRRPRDNFRLGTIEGLVQAKLHAIGDTEYLLVVFDADKECAVAHSQGFIDHKRVRLAVAVTEFEAWFLANLEDFLENPESIQGAKERLHKETIAQGGYRPTRDAPRLAATIDLDRVERNSRSFRHFVKVVGELVQGSD